MCCLDTFSLYALIEGYETCNCRGWLANSICNYSGRHDFWLMAGLLNGGIACISVILSLFGDWSSFPAQLLTRKWLFVCKVCGPHFVTFLNQTSIFEWCVQKVWSKNRYHKDMCWKEIGLLAWNFLVILGSIVHILGEVMWPFYEHENLW